MKTLKVGDKLPEFIAVDENGNNVKSTDWIGKKTIIFFYPRANTPGCTAEACNLRDNFKDCLLYTSPSPRDMRRSRMPSSA